MGAGGGEWKHYGGTVSTLDEGKVLQSHDGRTNQTSFAGSERSKVRNTFLKGKHTSI